jgi:prevent-host-death family protein
MPQPPAAGGVREKRPRGVRHGHAATTSPSVSSPRQVTIHEAKTQLSRLIKAAHEGETVIIARGNEPVAQLVPIEPPRKRQFGRYKGLFTLGPEFFEPLPEDELRAWEGE